MNRSLQQDASRSYRSPRNDAPSSFQLALGLSDRRLANSQTTNHVERQKLERLAQYSSRHADELRGLKATEAETKRERGILEWASQFSTECEGKLRSLRQQQTELRASGHRSKQSNKSLVEGHWDPSEHPRAPKGQSDGGQWIAKDGSGSDGSGTSTGIPVKRAIFSSSDPVDAHQIAWHPAIGHHWIPDFAIQHPDIRPFLSKKAIRYAAGAYSGPTDPRHSNVTFDGISHTQYNVDVKEQLRQFMDANGITKRKKMTAEQMKDFCTLIEKGLGADGKAHDGIAKFNKGVKSVTKKGFVPPREVKDVVAAGKKYMKTGRYRLMAAGAFITGVLADAVAQGIGVIDVAAKSTYYPRALAALRDGDLDKAYKLLVEERDSMYHEILADVGDKAALNFKAAVERAFENARNRDYDWPDDDENRHGFST